ncbi:MAG: DUF3332 domain-containing protein [Bacteroidales bacterium]|nr:DUF3332 domain-containing protein [Bacteroidales bacterium]
MKKIIRNSALMIAAAFMLSSCIGSFQLTNKVKDWNESLGDKFVNEVVFLAFHIVPVYQICMFADGVVFNSVEFWTGERLVADAGERQMIKNSFGKDVEIKTLKDGYMFSDGTSSMKVLYDSANKTWKVETDSQSADLIKFVDDNNAQLFLANGEVMDVTLDADGVEMAKAHIANTLSK